MGRETHLQGGKRSSFNLAGYVVLVLMLDMPYFSLWPKCFFCDATCNSATFYSLRKNNKKIPRVHLSNRLLMVKQHWVSVLCLLGGFLGRVR